MLFALCCCVLAWGVYLNMTPLMSLSGSMARLKGFLNSPHNFQEEKYEEKTRSSLEDKNQSLEISEKGFLSSFSLPWNFLSGLPPSTPLLEVPTPPSPSSPPSWEVLPSSVEMHCMRNPPRVTSVGEEFPEENADFLKTDEGKKFKTILVWTYAYGSTHLGFGYGHKPFKKACCKEPRCFLTGDRSKIPIKNFDAILFHFRSLKLLELPNERREQQRWIFYEKESPDYSYQDPAIYNGLFNWTMTYRKDSDIYSGYGSTYSRRAIWNTTETVPYKPVKKQLSKDTRGRVVIAAWAVSHCKTQSYRERYAEHLHKFIGVDVYGACGRLKCPTDQMAKCYRMMERKYKFYFSFENSLCKDYVTEKFFNILNYDLVPVVFGFGDYKNIAPPHSYISVLDFPSVKELANYLNYLHHNDTAYKEYFRWKQDYVVFNGHRFWAHRGFNYCNLCKILHSNSQTKIYHNLTKWFMDDAHCKRLRPFTMLERILKVNIE